jgi:WD domain, G-beta repeat/WD40-like Beta Propeller Repeat
VAASADAAVLVSAGEDRTGRLCDPGTGAEVRQLQGHQGGIDAVAVSPDGKTIATGGWQDHTIRLWDAATGQERVKIPLPTPNGHNYGNVPLAFSPDGTLLASGSADRANTVLFVWDTATGKQVCQAEPFSGPNGSLAFSPDGRTLAVGDDAAVRLLDPRTGEERGRLSDEGAAGTAVAFSPDGRVLAAGGGGERPAVRLWEVASGKPFTRVEGHGDRVSAAAFSPDGRTLATTSRDTTVLVWDVPLLTGEDGSRAKLSAEELQALWGDLGGEDVARARKAVWALASAPAESVPFLGQRLRPPAPAEPDRLRRLIADLDADDFAGRRAAREELERLGDAAAAALRQAREGKPSREAQRQLDQLLEKLKGSPSESLRLLRAVEALEYAGTPEARQALEKAADGGLPERLTPEVKASLARLGGR